MPPTVSYTEMHAAQPWAPKDPAFTATLAVDHSRKGGPVPRYWPHG